jgi:hypothetical protein
MVDCGVSPVKFAHRRAWLNIEILCFWVCIGVYVFMLVLKSRIIGGGLECGTIINRCFEDKADASEGSVGAVTSDTAIMKSHIVNSYESVLMIKYLD